MSNAKGNDVKGATEGPAMHRPPRGRRSARLRWALLIAGPVMIIAAAALYFHAQARYETTDNAYVQVAKAPVSASIGGRVVAVLVQENERVRAGQPLFRLDPRDYAVGEAEAAAKLAQAEYDVRARQASYLEDRSGVAAAQDVLAHAKREAARQHDLVTAGVASRQQADEAEHAVSQAKLKLDAAQRQAQSTLAAIGGDAALPAARHPAVLAAKAQLERARLNQSYTQVVAATDGTVTRVEQLQPGAFVNPSQTVFWLLTGKPYVEANFKEDQLADMHIGQPVEIRIDAFKGEVLKGHVESFSPGTGAVFSALPAQNATGNWVKVTQRLPVRIAFDGPPPAVAGRAGLSAHVRVDTQAAARAAPGA